MSTQDWADWDSMREGRTAKMEIMEHSVYFGDIEELTEGSGGSIISPYGDHTRQGLVRGINTWQDWHLIPSSRPEIAPPEVYTNYVDLPGCHGKLDLSEYLTGYPVYKNRTGSLEFYAANGYHFWAETYGQICNFLHGRRLYMVLYDEPEYFYTGRFRVNGWNSDGQTNWSTVTIDYELDPFKFLLPCNSLDHYYDRFLFEDIHPYQFLMKLNAAGGETLHIPGYTNGFMMDTFIDEESSFPASASVRLNDQTITLSRASKDAHTVRSGTFDPVTSPTNTIVVNAGNALVDLVFWGGHL